MKKHIKYLSILAISTLATACRSSQADNESKAEDQPFELSQRLKQELSLAPATLEPMQTQLQLIKNFDKQIEKLMREIETIINQQGNW